MVLGGFWARVGLEKKPPKIIRKSFFRVFERLNDSTSESESEERNLNLESENEEESEVSGSESD